MARPGEVWRGLAWHAEVWRGGVGQGEGLGQLLAALPNKSCRHFEIFEKETIIEKNIAGMIRKQETLKAEELKAIIEVLKEADRDNWESLLLNLVKINL